LISVLTSRPNQVAQLTQRPCDTCASAFSTD